MGRTKLIKDVNDLASRYPDLVSEWDWEANGDLTPSDILPKTHRHVHWVCEKGHKWEATPANRTHLNSGCPYCAREKQFGRKRMSPEKFKELCAEMNPDLEIIGEFDGTDNPIEVRCECGHVFQVPRAFRLAHTKITCRECLPVIEELGEIFKSKLAMKFPDIEMTGEYKGSLCKTEFTCSEGHVFDRTPSYMLSLSKGCTECRRRNRRGGKNGAA